MDGGRRDLMNRALSRRPGLSFSNFDLRIAPFAQLFSHHFLAKKLGDGKLRNSQLLIELSI